MSDKEALNRQVASYIKQLQANGRGKEARTIALEMSVLGKGATDAVVKAAFEQAMQGIL